MCTVSLVSQVGGWMPPSAWNQERFDQYQDILRRLERIDKQLGLPDCGNDTKEKLLHELASELGLKIQVIPQGEDDAIGKGIQP